MRIMRLVGTIWFFSLLFFPCISASGETADDLIASLKPSGPVLLCGERVPLDDPKVMERYEKEMLVALGNRYQVILWLKRSTRYFPFIERMLGEKNLPDDLKYLAVAESALRLHAGSSKGAMGMWQLMPQTAGKYGLTVNSRFDERRNPYLSTPAALAYLRDLYEQFGSWSLALAAYNMGEEGMAAEMLEQEADDYYRLYLPLETQRFVFRILVIKQIIDAPGAYGFHLAPDDYYPPETFSTVQVTATSDLPLRLIARSAGVDFKTIKDLNPEIRGHYMAAGSRKVSIPEKGKPGFQTRLASLVEAENKNRRKRIYVVREGDNLSTIADKFEVPLAAMLIWNRMAVDKVIHPGQELIISPGGEKNE